MKYVKYLLFMFLFIPGIVFGKMNYDDAVTYAKTYTSNLKDGYNKYFISDMDKFISEKEFETVSNGKISYLSYGGEYWSSTLNGNEVYTISYSTNSKSKDYEANVRVCEYVNSNVIATGTGTSSNPWILESDVIKVVLLNENTSIGKIDDNSFTVANNESVETKFSILNDNYSFDTAYSYCDNDSNLTVDEDKLKVDNITKDTTCYVKWQLKDTAKEALYDEIDEIKVLNIYPKSNYLISWLEDLHPFDKNAIKIQSVELNYFNSHYSNILFKDDNGKWNYDVVIFGFSDYNSKKDLTSSSSSLIKNYMEDGKPVIMGHDTFLNETIASLASYFGVKYEQYEAKKFEYVTIANKDTDSEGIFTSYPYDINNRTLIVPTTHASWGVINDYEHTKVWIYSGNTTDPYLFTYSNGKINTAYIGTGHSDGESSEDERQILVNLIYFMFARTNK